LPWWKIYFPFFNKVKVQSSLAKELIKDPIHRFIHKYYLLIAIIVFLLLTIVVSPIWAITLVVAPGAFCWANVCILNIFGHQYKGGSNNKFLSLITLGEGNHKNHHTTPTESNTGGIILICLIE